MVTIEESYMSTETGPSNAGLEGKNISQNSNLLELPSSNPAKTQTLQLESSAGKYPEEKAKNSTYLDMPLLISDHDGEESEAESLNGSKASNSEVAESVNRVFSATQEVKRSIKEDVSKQIAENSGEISSVEGTISIVPDEHSENQETSLILAAPHVLAGTEGISDDVDVTPDALKCERSKVMKIVVKYMAMKISNSFPPPSARTVDPKEMPLDQFLMILVSRLQMTLPSFMKGIIYLFRYMDIIYFLRYVNQSNNFANYTDMGYEIKKLLIGCFRLVLARERKSKDWSSITGLSNAQINDIVKTLVGRLNGKLSIKNVELVKLRGEIHRFVTMVTKTV